MNTDFPAEPSSPFPLTLPGSIIPILQDNLNPWISHQCGLLIAIHHFDIPQSAPCAAWRAAAQPKLQLHPHFSPALLMLPGAKPLLSPSTVIGGCGRNDSCSHCLQSTVRRAKAGYFYHCREQDDIWTCSRVLIPSPRGPFLCRGPGRALCVWEQSVLPRITLWMPPTKPSWLKP